MEREGFQNKSDYRTAPYTGQSKTGQPRSSEIWNIGESIFRFPAHKPLYLGEVAGNPVFLFGNTIAG